MKSLMIGGLLIALLALSGNAAMAANTQVHTNPKAVHVTQPRTAARAAPRVAARASPRAAAPRPYAYAPGPLPFGIGQFIQSTLGGPLPPQYAQIVRNAVRQSASNQGPGSYDPSWDSPSPPIPIDNSASDAAIAGEEADLNALNQSMQATQEQNDEAEAMNNADIAAAQQTEINAGM